MKNVSRYLLAVMAFTVLIGTPSAQTPTYPYNHIHLNVPDPAVASVWYKKNIPGGRRITEAPDRIMYGSTRLMFLRNADRETKRRQRHRSHRFLGAPISTRR